MEDIIKFVVVLWFLFMAGGLVIMLTWLMFYALRDVFTRGSR